MTRLYLKTLGGLKRVHAVLRRLDDDFCDPAELRADSALGVPGLLKVVRAGRVVLGNALGSGVIESAAWLGFPAVDLRMVARRVLAAAVGHDLVVRRATGARRSAGWIGSAGDQADVPESALRGGVRSRSHCATRALD